MTTACDLLSVSDLKECTLRALEKLGGAGTADEIAAEVCGMNGIDFGSGDYASPVRRRMRSGFEFDLGLARGAAEARPPEAPGRRRLVAYGPVQKAEKGAFFLSAPFLTDGPELRPWPGSRS